MTSVIFALGVYLTCAQATTAPLVVLGNGPVQGFLADNGVEKFFGIPYAEPPVGDFRFEAPVPIAANWTETRDATKLQNSCYQGLFMNRFKRYNTPLSEDCLYLNVYRPGGQREENLAVMVWLHGGGYTTGTANTYDPSPLVKGGNVIVVTVNYRLSAFGFIYQEGKPSAKGIQDQQLALQWVKDNIGFFGGNRNRITVFGDSAGSGSVAHHIMSPSSKGLFERGIMQSGTLGASWATTPIAKAKARTTQLAEALGCSMNGNVDMNCLKEAAVEDIVQNIVSHFGPTPDGEAITADPFKLSGRIPSNDVDTLIGFTTSEGFIWLLSAEPSLAKLTENYSDLSYFSDLANVADLIYSSLGNQLTNFEMGNRSIEHLAITYEYIRHASTPLERLKAVDAFGADVHFRLGGVNFAAKLANEGYGKVYFYEFDHKFNVDVLGPPHHLYNGVGHCADLNAVFDFECNGGGDQTDVFGSDIFIRDQDESVRQRVVKYWTDFAKTGNPGNPFKEYNSDKRNYVYIVTEIDEERENYIGSYYNFWKKYMPKLAEFECLLKSDY